MNKDEFERIKAEEKAHLRKLRALKQQYRGVSRKKKVLDALNAMQRSDLDETHEQTLRQLSEDAALTEARLEIAMEDAGADTPEPEELTEADRAKLRKAEAAALIRQMKAEMGTPAPESTEDAAAGSRTIGRSPAAPSDLEREDQAAAKTTGAEATAAKSIGRAPKDDDPQPDAPDDSVAPPSKSIGRRREG